MAIILISSILFLFLIGVQLWFVLQARQTNRTFSQYIASTLQSNLKTQESNHLDVISQITSNLGRLDETTRSLRYAGDRLETHFQKMNDIFSSPKRRGIWGESSLIAILSDILPRQAFSIQHTFASGERVDALVKVGNLHIPIDAKFPLDQFVKMSEEPDPKLSEQAYRHFIRDIRSHISSIANKYIRPNEGTIDYALMYIPSEGVFHSVLYSSEYRASDDLDRYLAEQRVILVSPNTLALYLMTISRSIDAYHIQENISDVVDQIKQIEGDYRLAEDNFRLVYSHMKRVVSSFEKAMDHFERVQSHLDPLRAGNSNNENNE